MIDSCTYYSTVIVKHKHGFQLWRETCDGKVMESIEAGASTSEGDAGASASKGDAGASTSEEDVGASSCRGDPGASDMLA